MNRRLHALRGLMWAAAVALLGGGAAGQVHVYHHDDARPIASHVVIHQSGSLSADRKQHVEIAAVQVGAVILEQAATTTIVDGVAAENRQGAFSMSGEVLLHLDGRNILIKTE